VQLSSRNPARLLQTLQKDLPQAVTRLQATPLDITKPETLAPAFEGAHTVVSLVGLMHGKPEDFERAQWRGAENVAKAAKEVGARLIHISAIGANPASEIAYWRTKGLGEEAVRSVHSNATIIRPSLVFGPEDDFFNVSAICGHTLTLDAEKIECRDSLNYQYSSLSCQCLEVASPNSSPCTWMILQRQLKS
jgi:NADH dehydrogenase